MKELLLLCTKHIHLTLGPLLANVYMCSLKKSIVPTLEGCLVHWKTVIHDTHGYIGLDKIDYVFKKLKTSHQQV